MNYEVEIMISNMKFENKFVTKDELYKIFMTLTPTDMEKQRISEKDFGTIMEIREAYLSLALHLAYINNLTTKEKQDLISNHYQESFRVIDRLMYRYTEDELNRQNLVKALINRSNPYYENEDIDHGY